MRISSRVQIIKSAAIASRDSLRPTTRLRASLARATYEAIPERTVVKKPETKVMPNEDVLDFSLLNLARELPDAHLRMHGDKSYNTHQERMQSDLACASIRNEDAMTKPQYDSREPGRNTRSAEREERGREGPHHHSPRQKQARELASSSGPCCRRDHS